jgi:hypothetical protein
MDAGDTSTVLLPSGTLLASVLSAADAGADQDAAASPANSRTRIQRTAGRGDDRVEFFKTHQR